MILIQLKIDMKAGLKGFLNHDIITNMYRLYISSSGIRFR
jgi:hypothetical protein